MKPLARHARHRAPQRRPTRAEVEYAACLVLANAPVTLLVGLGLIEGSLGHALAITGTR